MWKIIGIIGCLIGILSGEDTWEREVIAEVWPDSLQYPANQDSGTLSEMVYVSDSLKGVLEDYSVEMIKKLSPNFDPADTLGIVEETGDTVRLTDWSLFHIFRFPTGSDIPAIINALSQVPEVASADPNGIVLAGSNWWPDDPHLSDTLDEVEPHQWGLYNPGEIKVGNEIYNPACVRDVDVDAAHPSHPWEAAWTFYRGNSDTRIGIIDCGIDKNHEDFLSDGISKVIGDEGFGGTQNFQDWHGTHVAGIAAAYSNNSKGIAGVDWYATLVSKRMHPSSEEKYVPDIIRSAVNDWHCNILNNSWYLGPPSDPDPYFIPIRRAFADAYKLNRISTCCTGNDSEEKVLYPSGYWQGIIAVGGVTAQGGPYGNYGPHLDIVAPCRTWSTVPNNGYAPHLGTSMSTAFASGVASLLYGYAQEHTDVWPGGIIYNDDIENIITLTATPPTWENAEPEMSGQGLLNAHQALRWVRGTGHHFAHHQSPDYEINREVVDITEPYLIWFFDTPNVLGNGPHLARRYEVWIQVQIPPYQDWVVKTVWGDGVPTYRHGLSPCEGPWRKVGDTWVMDTLYQYGMGWCELVPGSLTGNTAIIRTFVYKVRRSLIDPRYVWAPCDTSQAYVGYTVVYAPPSDSYPSSSITKSQFSPHSQSPVSLKLYSNPFNITATIQYQIAMKGNLNLAIYNATGRLVKNLVNTQECEPGVYTTTWNGKDEKGRSLPPGAYFCVLETQSCSKVVKLLKVR